MSGTTDAHNNLDLWLLKNEPHKFVLRYQNAMMIVAKIFIRNGEFAPSEMKDLIQFLNLHVLERLDRIREQYDGSSMMRTYMAAVFRHALINLVMKRQIEPVLSSLEGYPDRSARTPDGNLHIESDIRVLEGILQTYHRERQRTVLLLKLHYGVPVAVEDLNTWGGALSDAEKGRFLEIAMENEGSRKRSRLFELLQPLIDKMEGVERRPGVLRTSIYKRIEEILRMLNGSPPTANYDVETLGILFEKLCNYKSSD